MKQVCYLCANRCPLDALSCGEGRRMYANEVLLRGGERDEREVRASDLPSGSAGRDSRKKYEGAGEAPARAGEDSRVDLPEDADPRPPRFAGAEPSQAAEPAASLELFDLCHRVLRRIEAAAPRGQDRALMLLAARGEMRQRELQDALHVQPASMSELLQKLERKGYLTRARGEDRRAKRLRITQAGREAASQLRAAPDEDPFSALTADQRAQFLALLTLVAGSAGGQDPLPPASPLE